MYARTRIKGNAALVVVDMSVEQVSELKDRKEDIIESIRNLASRPEWECKVDSHLWVKDPSQTSLSEIYPGIGAAGTEGAELIPELHDLGLEFVEKKHFSSFVNSSLFNRLQESNVNIVVIVGINTDYCIFLTAMDSFARGRFKTLVVADAVGSISGRLGHEEGLRRIQAHLPTGSVVHSRCITFD